MNSNPFILEMDHVSKYFPGVQALDDVHLQVRQGTIHALMGENGAGKSTLMKCLFGIYKKDEGEIKVDGQTVNFENPRQALDNGVAMVHQELNQVLELSVVENVWLGRMPRKGIIVDQASMLEDTKELFERLSIPMNPKEKIGSLSVSQRQMVEIAKAVSCNAKVLVLDEPTSSLTDKEVQHLFKIMRTLTKQGCGIVYISHKMEEILQISDEVTVMRDGKWIATTPAKDLTTDKIISQMVGRELSNRFPPKTHVAKDRVVMRVQGLTGYYQPSATDVSFDLREGEVLGVSGLVGARRTETVETLFGMRTLASGTVEINGEPVTITSPQKAISLGLSLVTEERRFTGIFEGLGVSFNMATVNLPNYCNVLTVVDDKAIRRDTEKMIDAMNIKTPSHKTVVGNLSGGNQQKVIVGRWLLKNPNILMMDEPTRGIDVGAKYEIYQIIDDLAREGKSVIFISSEMPELLGVSDRIMVMSNGRVAGIVEADKTSQEEIMALSAKYL